MTAARTYRLAAQDRTGWFLGLDAVQVTAITTGLLTGSLLAAHRAVPVAAVVVLFGLGAAFLQVKGQPIHRLVVPSGAFYWRQVMGRNRWFAPVDSAMATQPALPPGCGAIDVVGVPSGPLARFAGDVEVAVVSDRKWGHSAAGLRISGPGFALADPADQDRFCSGWGDALAACATGASTLAAVQVSVRSLPNPAVPGSIRRETIVTVIDNGHRRDGAAPVVTEAARLADRLIAAGLSVDEVLDTKAWTTVVRESFDPLGEADRFRSLGERAGVSHPMYAGPMAVTEDWSAVRIDGSWHRAYLVADWPRVELPAAWLVGLLLTEGLTWTLTVSFEPVPAAKARQAVERQAAKLSSDEEQRRRAGFRVGATHQRQHEDLEAREVELVAGHAEYQYVGIATVSAATREALDEDGATLVAAAAGCGVELRALHGRHLSGVGASIPVPAAIHRKGSR